MIHNAEIHITRADPKRHYGREGFVYAITWAKKRAPGPSVFLTRVAAAVVAADHLDAIEACLQLEVGGKS